MLKVEHGFVPPNSAAHAHEHMQLVALCVDLDCAESRRLALEQIVDHKRGHLVLRCLECLAFWSSLP